MLSLRNMNDKLFDWYPISKDNLLDKIIEKVFSQIESSRKTTKGVTTDTRLNERNITIHLVNALYLSHFSFPKNLVSINLTAKYYSGKKYGYKNVKKVINALENGGLVTLIKGSEVRRQVTRIKHSRTLEKLLDKIGFQWRYYPPDKDETFVFKRDRVKTTGKKKKYKKITLPLPKTDFYKQQQKRLLSFNQFISKNCIALDVSNSQFKKIIHELNKKKKQRSFFNEEHDNTINYSLTHLRRVFARGKNNLGGRFYGGWWQSIPSKYRHHITINGKKTVEVDFSTMSLRLLYSKENIPMDVDRDLYDLGLTGNTKYLTRARELVKLYTNALLNDEGGKYRLKKSELKELKLTHYQLNKLVNTYHKPIVHHFSTGVGLELMFLDSIIAQRLMTFFQKQNIVILPIHDSFIVPVGFELSLRAQMKHEYKKLMKTMIKVKSSLTKIRDNFEVEVPLEIQPEEQIVGSEQVANLVLSNDDGLYESYISGWYSWVSS